MRIETVKAWVLVGMSLLVAGMYLDTLNVTKGGKLAIFLTGIGFVYFGIGVVLMFIHDRHMTKRTRARDGN